MSVRADQGHVIEVLSYCHILSSDWLNQLVPVPLRRMILCTLGIREETGELIAHSERNVQIVIKAVLVNG